MDHTPFGMKSCIPIIQLSGYNARKVVNIVDSARRKYALNLNTSFFGDGRTLITIHFRTDDTRETECAQDAELHIWNDLVSEGFPPYRVSIDQMDRLMRLYPQPFALAAQLKSVLDPNDVIAPGRYCKVGAYTNRNGVQRL
ncbi:MAG: hypothetical protein P0111_11880 [Nitrospira sp.]|nr:hypothetical protein [Nitrospira sp.]